eukprot:jgi/Botrbrau1/3350/Bobra.0048s0044.1
MTMDVVGTIGFGVRLRTQEVDEPGNEDAQALISSARAMFRFTQTTSAYFALANLFPFLHPVMALLATHLPDPGMVRLRKDRKVLLDVSEKLVREARASQRISQTGEQPDIHKGTDAAGKGIQISASSSFNEELKATRKVEKGGFLQLMVNAKHKDGRPFTDPEIVEQAFTFLLAGYETTAATLGFCVHNLSTNPDKLAKLLKELDSLPADYVPSVDELVDGLPYVNAVFKETLRLYPIAVFTARELQDDCSVLGYNLPKGTNLHISIYNMHRDPEVWKNPDEFIPERWIDGEPEAEGRPQNAWFPFGDGNVGCVGMRLAQLEAKITLIRLFQRFTFNIDPAYVPMPLDGPVMLGPKDGYLAVPVKRQK